MFLEREMQWMQTPVECTVFISGPCKAPEQVPIFCLSVTRTHAALSYTDKVSENTLIVTGSSSTVKASTRKKLPTISRLRKFKVWILLTEMRNLFSYCCLLGLVSTKVSYTLVWCAGCSKNILSARFAGQSTESPWGISLHLIIVYRMEFVPWHKTGESRVGLQRKLLIATFQFYHKWLISVLPAVLK